MAIRVKPATVETSLEFTFADGAMVSLSQSQVAEIVAWGVSETCRNCPQLTAESKPTSPKTKRKKPVLDP
jgi:hypothetical protein